MNGSSRNCDEKRARVPYQSARQSCLRKLSLRKRHLDPSIHPLPLACTYKGDSIQDGKIRSGAMDPPVTSPSFSSAASSSSWFAGIVRGRSIKSNSGGGAPSIPVSTDGSGPGSRKNQLRGALFKYGPKPIQVFLDDFEPIACMTLPPSKPKLSSLISIIFGLTLFGRNLLNFM
ncbi:hypothetical protein B296_00021585 [Ensete ventricosum]|uniref:Uncharacterized protein n=1 Tax=Ensete ventricosum TaxID=4639 RepID=A0A426Z062_ENSVE|nr:hypothetical protein B296_00021585 [Ensete ventricosum]